MMFLRQVKLASRGRAIVRAAVPVGAAAIAFAATSCITVGSGALGPNSFRITINKVNGADPPTAASPLRPNLGDREDLWDISVDSVDPLGKATPFEGFVRASIRPGSLISVEDPPGSGNFNTGRNILVHAGHAEVTLHIKLVYGPARVWVEDLGYIPAKPGTVPKCSDGKDNNGNKLVDFPADPGCYAADDDSEDGGTFATAVSPNVNYDLPTLAQIEGNGLQLKTPYEFNSVQAKTDFPETVVVTRVSQSGFYVTDLNGQTTGWNSLYAFNFSPPIKMQVCDQVVYLAGTMSDFYGYTEMNFPSYRLKPLFVGQEDLCQVPEPTLLDAPTILNTPAMKKYEAGLVRIVNYSTPKHFGPGLVVNNQPAAGASNCDFDGNGKIDFTSTVEASCAASCDADLDCAEWTEYTSRGNYKVRNGTSTIQINTDGASQFQPQASPGLPLTVSGTLAYFSGGKNNWTVESRCTDDVVCTATGCSPTTIDSKHACVQLTRTIDDNDSGTN